MDITRRLKACLVAVGLVAMVSACSSEDQGPDPGDRIAITEMPMKSHPRGTCILDCDIDANGNRVNCCVSGGSTDCPYPKCGGGGGDLN
jgi:hypothetical protein